MISIKNRLQRQSALSVLAFVAAGMAAPTSVSAQTSEDASAIDTIIITARKKPETLLEAPLSLQAFSKATLDSAGLIELESLATFTPNLDFQNVGNSQPGRFNTAIRFRGMESTITTPTTQTGAFLVDGINMLGGASSVDFSDIARIEVIRGPQPVFFGRGTFGGAINYITADPGEELGGSFSLTYSPNFGSNYLSGYLEGQIAEGLTARITAFSRTKGAMFTATDGGDLGEENTDGISAIVLYEPNDRLKIKTRIAYSQDDDGPPSASFVKFSEVGNVPLGTELLVNSTTGEQTGSFARTWLSGNVPFGAITSNTTFYEAASGSENPVDVRDALLNLAPDPGSPELEGFGLRNNTFSASLAGDYDASDSISLAALFGYNKRSTSQIRDVDQTDSPAWATRTFLDLTSYSLEGRVAYDNDGPLRIMGGLSYAYAEQFGDIDGGFSVIDGIFGGLQVGYGTGSLDILEIKTLGVFAAVEYDILDWLTFAAEARFQSDKSTPSTGNIGVGITVQDTLEYNEFLPRFILSAQPMDGMNLYASFSKGSLPGVRNTVFDGLSAEDRVAAQAAFPQVVEEIGAETLETFELGWKQALPDQNLWFSLVGFYQEWTNMKSNGSFIFTSPNTGESAFLFSTVAGESKMKGIEFEASWAPIEQLRLQTSYGFVDAEYTDFINQTFDNVLGLSADSSYKADGSQLPRSPKHSGTVSATWTNDLVEDWTYSLRADAIYRGKTFTDALNLTTIDSYTLVNARVAFDKSDMLSLEVYCTNCFGQDGWATGRRLTDFSPIPNFFGSQGVVVDPIDRFEAGVRATFNF